MNDISQFVLSNVVDTCSLWNLLASPLLYGTAKAVGLQICCTDFVIYECLHKHSKHWPERVELQRRLAGKLKDASIISYPIELEDLQQVDVLRNRKRLSIGELSVMVFAGKTQQAMFTDDKNAQKLALTHLSVKLIQSTPHLIGWLYVNSFFGDADITRVKAELNALARNYDKHIDLAYGEALQCRAVVTHGTVLQAQEHGDETRRVGAHAADD